MGEASFCPTQNPLRLSPRDGCEHGAYLIWRRNVHEAKKRCTKLKRLHHRFNFPKIRWKTWEKKAVYLRWDTPQRQLGLVLRQWCHLWIITTAKFVINIFHPKSLLKLKKWWSLGKSQSKTIYIQTAVILDGPRGRRRKRSYGESNDLILEFYQALRNYITSSPSFSLFGEFRRAIQKNKKQKTVRPLPVIPVTRCHQYITPFFFFNSRDRLCWEGETYQSWFRNVKHEVTDW